MVVLKKLVGVIIIIKRISNLEINLTISKLLVFYPAINK